MPLPRNPAMVSSQTGSSMTTACSATQAVPLSKDFDSLTIVAASAMSATERWTYTGTFPAPTAMVGLPDE